MEKIQITLEEAKAVLALRDIHKRNLFRDDYEQVMEEPVRNALEKIGREPTEENREWIINLSSIYFDVLKIV